MRVPGAEKNDIGPVDFAVFGLTRAMRGAIYRVGGRKQKGNAVVIRAKYDGKCRKCGQSIRAGEQIEWSRESGAGHVTCPAKKETAPTFDGPTYKLYGGSGYGCRGWRVGSVFAANPKHRAEGWPEFVTILTASSRCVYEDGLSFGVGDDEGTLYSATARAATEEEAVPVREKLAAVEKAATATAVRDAALKELCGLCRAGLRVGNDSVDIPIGEQIVVLTGSGGSGREVVVVDDVQVSWWCSGYYDDYRRSLYTTTAARAVELARMLKEMGTGAGA